MVCALDTFGAALFRFAWSDDDVLAFFAMGSFVADAADTVSEGAISEESCE